MLFSLSYLKKYWLTPSKDLSSFSSPVNEKKSTSFQTSNLLNYQAKLAVYSYRTTHAGRELRYLINNHLHGVFARLNLN